MSTVFTICLLAGVIACAISLVITERREAEDERIERTLEATRFRAAAERKEWGR